MKKLILAPVLALVLVGCATQSHTVSSVDANGKPVVDKTKTTQSDNGAIQLLTTGLDFLRDTTVAVLPPIIPIITKELTSPVVGAATNAP